MDNKQIIGKRIAAAMALKNLKQKDLATHLEVTDNTISYFCSGSRTPNTTQIIEIAKFLEVSSDYLLGIVKDKTPDQNIQSICSYTGLSDTAIQTLNTVKGSYISAVVSALIDELGDNISKYLCTEQENGSSALQKIATFLNTRNINSEPQKIIISKSGKIIDTSSTDMEYVKQLSANDCIATREIDVNAIINQVMLNDIEKALVKLKSTAYLQSGTPAPELDCYNSSDDLPFDI